MMSIIGTGHKVIVRVQIGDFRSALDHIDLTCSDVTTLYIGSIEITDQSVFHIYYTVLQNFKNGGGK